MLTKVHSDHVDLLRISNFQCKDSGKPPNLVLEPGQFVSYFENHYGEQWMLVVAKGKNSATLYGGDIKWTEPVKMDAPYWLDNINLHLNREELHWILSCIFSIEHDRATQDKFLNIIQLTGKIPLSTVGMVARMTAMKESQFPDKEAVAHLKELGMVFAPEET